MWVGNQRGRVEKLGKMSIKNVFLYNFFRHISDGPLTAANRLRMATLICYRFSIPSSCLLNFCLPGFCLNV